MGFASTAAESKTALSARFDSGDQPVGIILRLAALALIDAFAIWWCYRMVADGVWFLTLTVAVITLGINLFYLSDGLRAYRWFTPGLVLMVLMVLYPTAFTVYVAFTNYGDGNLLTQPQALDILLGRRYLPEDAITYDWTAYRDTDGETILWLESNDGAAFVAQPGVALVAPEESTLELQGYEGGTEPPEAIGPYEQLTPIQAATDASLQQIEFGAAPTIIQISGSDAAQFQPRYDHDEAANTLTDQQTGMVYRPVDGTFTSEDGEQLRPGYYVVIGMDNFVRLFTSDAIRGPFFTIFVWTFLHAFLAVLVTFSLGVFLAVVLNHPIVPFKKIFRSLILIPYAIPAFISVLVWRGMFDPNFGVVNDLIAASSFGLFDGLPWRSSAFWARSAIILIQLWLGFPYMLLICTGALQGIPSDMYEAAEVDGASAWRQFWNLTLPLLLVAVGPLLIASFAFNFNNFTIIQLYLDGGPAIPNTTTPAGYTDILITYTYRVAFSSGRGADYGFATAITIVIFLLLTVVTIFNFRLTRRLEEISENV